MSANMFSHIPETGALSPNSEQIHNLATFLNPTAHAVTFCYSLHSFPDRSHRTEELAIKNLVQAHVAKFAPGDVPTTLSADLGKVAALAQQIKRDPTNWRILYACDEKNIVSEFDLPAPESAAQLSIAGHFFLRPLLEAIQSCRPYRVVLVESGKARLFEIHGTEIREIEHLLPEGNLRRRSEDSRVGWSKRVEGNVEHREQAWFRTLVDALTKLPGEHGPGTLILGCRDDMRGELRPYFRPIETHLMGSFHLANIEVSAGEVLKEARRIFEKYELDRCRNLRSVAEEGHERCASGVNEVLAWFSEGKVRTLLLGEMNGQMMSECERCGHLQPVTDSSCTFCFSPAMIPIPADEALIRRALAQKAEILIYPHDERPMLGVAAFARY